MIRVRILYYFLLIFIVFFSNLNKSYPQLEASHWYFGGRKALKFDSAGPVQIYNSKMDANRGTSSISDKYGNLLFYSNGKTIWNKVHDTLKNGFGLNSNGLSDQAPLIVPMPGNPGIYYLFTVFSPGGSYYTDTTIMGFWCHIVNMEKDSGKGEVILKNKLICKDVIDKVAATMHADKQSIWIVVKDYYSNKLKAFLLTNKGINFTPVVSSVGTNLMNNVNKLEEGQFKFSPSGKKLANVIQDGFIDVFDFDNKNGKFFNPIILNLLNMPEFNKNVYGLEFSPNENYIYTTCHSIPGKLHQFDLTSGIDSVIKNSIFTVYSKPNDPRFWCLQIGLDKKIYVARPGYYLGCINNPDKKGISCNYIDSTIRFNPPGFVGMSLPTFLQSYFYLPDIEIKNTCLGDTSYFKLKDTTNIDSLCWSFGDSSYSWDFYPKHIYADTGYYQTKAVIFYDNTSDTFEREIHISNYAYPDFGFKHNPQCALQNIEFYDSSVAIDGSMTYQWDFGDNTKSFQQNPVKSYSNADTFNVILTVTSSYGCESSINKNIIVRPSPLANVKVSDTIQCLNQNQFQFFNPNDSLTQNVNKIWYFGDGDSSITDTVLHIYSTADSFLVSLIETNTYGCKDTATRQVIVHPSPKADFSVNDSSQCFKGNGFSFINSSTISSGTMSYLWNFGNGDTSTVVSPNFNYLHTDTITVKLVAISNLGCKDSIDRNIYVFPDPKALFTMNYDKQCKKDNLFQFSNVSSISSGTLSFYWNFGDSSQSVNQAPSHQYSSAGNHVVKLLAVSDHGCKDSMVKNVVVYSMPKAKITVDSAIKCFNDNFFTFNDNSESDYIPLTYNWDFGDSSSVSKLKNPNHSYNFYGKKTVSLKVINPYNCEDNTSILITVHPSPVADFTINNKSQCLVGNKCLVNNISSCPVSFSSSFNFGDGNIVYADTASHKYDSAANYPIILTVISKDGCIATKSDTTKIHPNPISKIIINDSTQCLKGNQISISAIDGSIYNIPSDLLTYKWFYGNGDSSTDKNPVYSYPETGIYKIKLYLSTYMGCIDSAIQNIEIYPMPQAAFEYKYPLCLDKSMVLTNNSTIASPDYISDWKWQFDTEGSSADHLPVFSFQQSGDKIISLNAKSNHGCENTVSHKIHLFDYPVKMILERATVEENLPDGKAGNKIKIEWQPPSNGNPKITYLKKSQNNIDYYLFDSFSTKENEYFDNMVSTGKFSYSYMVQVKDSCDYLSTESNIGKTILLQVDTSGEFAVITWTPYELWVSGVSGYELQVAGTSKLATDKNFIKIEDYFTPATVIDSNTKLKGEYYCYRVIAKRNNDFLESVSNEVCIPAITRLFVPNAFSPNNDGINDVFKPVGIHILNYHLQIFSRWGELIFESNDLENGWDGKIKGNYCPAGTYTYTITISGANGTGKRYSGSVQLIR